MTRSDILKLLRAEIARETGLPEAEVGDDASFESLGLNSISAIYILDKLEKKMQIEMSPMYFWDYPTVGLMADHLTSLRIHE